MGKEANVGDIIQVLSVGENGMFYSEGDFANVLPNPNPEYYDEPGALLADFNNMNNPSVSGSGLWWLQPSTGATYQIVAHGGAS